MYNFQIRLRLYNNSNKVIKMTPTIDHVSNKYIVYLHNTVLLSANMCSGNGLGGGVTTSSL